MIGNICRRNAFWAIDRLKGGRIKKHYIDIKTQCENVALTSAQYESKVTKLLRYAVENVEMYHPYHNFIDLKSFPIIDKRIISEAGSKALSPEFKAEQLVKMYTSGSSGTPFISYQNKDKKDRVRAEVVYFGEQCGYQLGDKNVYLRVWTQDNKKSPLGAWMQNMVMIDITRLDTDKLEFIRTRFKKDKNIKILLGYPSTYDILATYCLEKGDTPDMYGIKTIISSAETIRPSTRKKLLNLYGSQIVSRYSNQENGILAQELSGEDFYVLNKSSYFYEFLKLDRDEPAAYGEMARIILTDLYNYAMPMIRYDTKDIAIVGQHPQYGQVIHAICGRREDQIYTTAGLPIMEGPIDIHMIQFKKILQYQIIQESQKAYTLKVADAKDHYPDEVLIQTLQKVLGDDAVVQVVHLDEINRLISGKFQMFISNYKPKVTTEALNDNKLQQS